MVVEAANGQFVKLAGVLGIPQVAAVTALVAAVMTILMGVVARAPFAIATGLEEHNRAVAQYQLNGGQNQSP